jgi:hypothetical protein
VTHLVAVLIVFARSGGHGARLLRWTRGRTFNPCRASNRAVREKAKQIAENLKQELKLAQDWERLTTSIPGIFVVRLPGPIFQLKLEFNPPKEDGVGSKRRGLYFEDHETVEAVRAAFPDKRLDDLVDAVIEINGEAKAKSGGRRAKIEL